MAEAGRALDLAKVKDAFSSSKKEDGEILIDEYVAAYTELCGFFQLLGTVFQFVLTDVKDKLDILRQHRSSEYGMNYITIQSMVNYEVSNKITKVKGKPPSGSRTLLRLHRAMEFLVLFLRDISEAKPEEKLQSIASNAYYSTLSKHHTWLIRKAVGLALYTLPTREQLLQKLNYDSDEQARELISELVKECQLVYDIVQSLYTDNDLLALP